MEDALNNIINYMRTLNLGIFSSDIFAVNTVIAVDGNKPYKTMVSYVGFNDDYWMTVEQYDTEKQALEGHEEWIHKLRVENPKCFINITEKTGNLNIIKKDREID